MIQRKTPLHLKASILSSFFLCLFAILIVFSTHSIINEKLTSELKQDTLQIIKAINEKAEFIIIFESQSEIEELHTIFQSFPYIIKSQIKNNQGKIVSQFINDEAPSSNGDIIVKDTITKSEDIDVFQSSSAEQSNNTIGSIEITVSTFRLERIQKSILKTISMLGSIFIAFISITYFVTTKRLLKPLHNMIAIMQKFVSDSKFTSKATAGTTKEFAQIATAYNSMMNHIESITTRLDTSNKSLTEEIIEKEKSYHAQQQLEEQLSQAQKLEAIGRMTAGIAHDFNNILGGILGFSRLALDEIKSLEDSQKSPDDQFEDLKDSINEILLGGERAQGIIRQLLVSSRKAESKPVVINIEKAIQQLLPLLKTSVSVNVHLRTNILSSINVLMDPTHFEQVILNLIINAKDAMDAEGTINISAQMFEPQAITCTSCKDDVRLSQQVQTVIVCITDSGSGIEPDALSQIFDPFYSTKAKDKGTGMGLSIIHGLVHKNNGHIHVQSVIGAGTTFGLIFPLAQEQQLLPSNTHSGEQKQEKIKQNAANENELPILIVDDNIQLLKFMRILLESNGYTVHAFEQPTQALTTFIQNQGQYLLVISDYIMPKLSGDQLCKAILRYKQDTNIIICSGYNDNLHDETAKIPGAVYLSKPIENDELLHQIAQFSLKNLKQG